jgi:hypothetical protein
VRVEAVSVQHFGQTTDPVVELRASASDGVVSVVATATHPLGGFQRHFGELTRTGNNFSAVITGSGGGSTTATESSVHTYELGRLAPGVYTITATSGTRTLAILRLRVTRDGLSLDTPLQPTM